MGALARPIEAFDDDECAACLSFGHRDECGWWKAQYGLDGENGKEETRKWLGRLHTDASRVLFGKIRTEHTERARTTTNQH